MVSHFHNVSFCIVDKPNYSMQVELEAVPSCGGVLWERCTPRMPLHGYVVSHISGFPVFLSCLPTGLPYGLVPPAPARSPSSVA